MSTEPTPIKTENQPPKKLWDTVLTATPIILTVLGTLLASRSSSEMTLAQYYRSIAAQNQSKAGDQWSFFQAKKIRGTIQQMYSENGAFNPSGALTAYKRLPKTLERSVSQASLLLDAANSAQKAGESSTATNDLDSLKKAVEQFQTSATVALKQAKESQTALAKALASDTGAASSNSAAPGNLVFLTTKRLPVPTDERDEKPRDVVAAVVVDPALVEVLAAIRAAKPAAEINQKLKKVDEAKIGQAIEAAEAKAAKFDKSTDPVADAIQAIDQSLQNQQMLLRPLLAANEDVQAVVVDLNPTDDKLATIRTAAAALQSTVGRLETDSHTVMTRFKAARSDYDCRRYEREAKFNQEIAALYELQVRKSSLTSDQHRDRSMFFVYGMLLAQAGVTIATFGLAVRQKSVLWALATAAGVTAITIGIFAYQFI